MITGSKTEAQARHRSCLGLVLGLSSSVILTSALSLVGIEMLLGLCLSSLVILLVMVAHTERVVAATVIDTILFFLLHITSISLEAAPNTELLRELELRRCSLWRSCGSKRRTVRTLVHELVTQGPARFSNLFHKGKGVLVIDCSWTRSWFLFLQACGLGSEVFQHGLFGGSWLRTCRRVVTL